MKLTHKELIKKVINAIDWKSIMEVHKAFNIGIGSSNISIPGVVMKNYSESLTENDLKKELRSILKYVIENDIPEINYSYWVIYWTNDDWDFRIDLGGYEDEEEMEEMEDEAEDDMIINVRPKIEMLYAPQKLIMVGDMEENDEGNEKEDENFQMDLLEKLLAKSIHDENYEQSSKIRDLIRAKNKKSR
jgi:hypothetical protein